MHICIKPLSTIMFCIDEANRVPFISVLGSRKIMMFIIYSYGFSFSSVISVCYHHVAFSFWSFFFYLNPFYAITNFFLLELIWLCNIYWFMSSEQENFCFYMLIISTGTQEPNSWLYSLCIASVSCTPTIGWETSQFSKLNIRDW